MKTLIGLTVLSVLLCLSLACSSGEQVPGNSITTFKTPIPYDIRTSFKAVPGGVLEEFLKPVDATFFNDLGEGKVIEIQTEVNGYGDDLSVSSFNIMDTEVTIQMFADFMNSLEQNFDLIVESTDTITGADGQQITIVSTAFTQPSLGTYKAVMQDFGSCGIYMLDQSGQDISGEISQTAGFTFNGKPELEDGYVDPVVHFVGKPRGATKGIRYEVAPGREHYPMVYVDRTEAKQFAKWLGTGFRLPTPPEYQYAGRGGQRVDFATSTGGIYKLDEDGETYINSFTGQPEYLANIQGEFSQNSGTTRVKSFPPNAYGLYDLTGNVYEWTINPNEDISIATTGATQVLGGSFASTFLATGSTWAFLHRDGAAAEGVWATDLGFRVIYKGSLETIAQIEPAIFPEDEVQ